MTHDGKRSDLLEKLADYLLAHGIAAASLRPMAAAVGTSDRMLLYYFDDRDDLIAATLATVSVRLVALLDASGSAAPRPYAALLRDVWATFRAPAFRPYLQLWLEVAARAAGGAEPFRTVGGRIADGFLDWAGQRLAIADASDRRAAAALLLGTIDGLALLEAVGRGVEADAAAASVGAGID